MTFRVAVLLCVAFLPAVAAFCDDPPDPPGAAAATAPTTAPATQAARVVATVGDIEIAADRLERILAKVPPNFPPEQLAALRSRLLSRMIRRELVHAYLVTMNAACSDEELAAQKQKLADTAAAQGMTAEQLMAEAGLTDEMLRDEVRLNRLMGEATSKEKAAAFVKAHPEYFNGTRVSARHILIVSLPESPTAEQKEALAKIEAIASQMNAGKVSFEEAAKAHSSCPSSAKGGDLGEFTYERMVPSFSQAAFALKPGQTSGVVRSSFGFHLIQVTGRTEGKDAPGQDAEEIAAASLGAALLAEIMGQAMTTCPIVINR